MDDEINKDDEVVDKNLPTIEELQDGTGGSIIDPND